MINLTPKEEKKKINADFYLRLLIVFFISVALSVWVWVIAMVPSYFAISLNEKSIENKLKNQKNTPVPALDIETTTLIKGINSKVSLIEESETNKFVVSERVINQILLKKTPEIKINQISYSEDPSGKRQINISGLAPSRDKLLLFRRGLEENTFFKTVDLPISNFVKGSNISFFISLTPS